MRREGDMKGEVGPVWVDTCQSHINHTLEASSTMSKRASPFNHQQWPVDPSSTTTNSPPSSTRLYPRHFSPASPGRSPPFPFRLYWFQPLSFSRLTVTSTWPHQTTTIPWSKHQHYTPFAAPCHCLQWQTNSPSPRPPITGAVQRWRLLFVFLRFQNSNICWIIYIAVPR